MVESESKFGGLIRSSWADEVEKEEEEEAQARLQQKKQKQNPFGSARPREVVLQEKGIDWRKLDLHLQQTSLARQDPLNEKSGSKENIPATSYSNRVRVDSESEPQSKCIKQRLKDSNLGFNLLATPNTMHLMVPSLKYPPRNMVASQAFHCRSKKNIIHRNGLQGSHCHEQILNIEEQGSQFNKNTQPLAKSRNLQNPRRKIDGNGQNVMGSLLGRPPVQDKMHSTPSGSITQQRWKHCTSYKKGAASQEENCREIRRSVAKEKWQELRTGY